VVNNPWVHPARWGSVWAILQPWGDPALYTANWAPLHLLACMGLWQAFGADPLGWHLVNVLAHALVASLLVWLYVRSGIPRSAAALLGLLFLVHPANVEAVAWIFQLKTILALGLALGALLAFRHRPLLAALLFGLALLAKISAAFALPVAAAALWCRPAQGRGRAAWGGLLLWALLLLAVALPELGAFQRMGEVAGRSPDLAGQLRGVLGIVARYAAMAATSWGVSTFQEPALPAWSDPQWALGAATLAVLALRTAITLRQRRLEAAFWIWAAAAWAPVSQVLPFLYPLADRYLYMILPGLLGGSFLWAQQVLAPRLRRLSGQESGGQWPRGLERAGLAAGLAVAALFALHTSRRTPIWRSDVFVTLDAARHYPDGLGANFLRARGAASRGETRATLEALRRIADRGFDGFQALERDPVLATLRSAPGYRAVLAQVAGNWVQTVRRRRRLLPSERLTLAEAQLLRGDREAALRNYQQVVREGGPAAAAARAALQALGRRGEHSADPAL